MSEEALALLTCQSALLLGHLLGATSFCVYKPNTTTSVVVILQLSIVALTLWILNPDAYIQIAPEYKKSSITLPTESAIIAWILSACCSGFVLGAFIAKLLSPKSRTVNWYETPTTASTSSLRLKRYIPLAIFISSVLTIVYVQYIGGIRRVPLYMMLTGSNYLDIIIAREESFKFLPAPARYTFHTLRSFVFPAIVIFSYASLRVGKKSRKDFILFFLSFIIALIFNASSSALGPALWLFVYLAVFEVIGLPRTSFDKIRIGSIILIFLMLAHYALVSLTAGKPVNFLTASWEIINERILQRGTNILENASVFIDTFPPEEGHLGFSGYSKLATPFGYEQININNELYLNLAPQAKILSGTYNGPWFQYDFTNWGLIGVTLGALACGFLLKSMDAIFKYYRKDTVTVSLYCFSIVATLGLMDKPLHTWIISHGGILGVITLLIIKAKIAESKFA